MKFTIHVLLLAPLLLSASGCSHTRSFIEEPTNELEEAVVHADDPSIAKDDHLGIYEVRCQTKMLTQSNASQVKEDCKTRPMGCGVVMKKTSANSYLVKMPKISAPPPSLTFKREKSHRDCLENQKAAAAGFSGW